MKKESEERKKDIKQAKRILKIHKITLQKGNCDRVKDDAHMFSGVCARVRM